MYGTKCRCGRAFRGKGKGKCCLGNVGELAWYRSVYGGGIGEEGVCVIGVDGGKDEGSVPEASSSSSRGGGRGGDGSFTRYVYQCQSVCVVGRLPTLPSQHHNL